MRDIGDNGIMDVAVFACFSGSAQTINFTDSDQARKSACDAELRKRNLINH